MGGVSAAWDLGGHGVRSGHRRLETSQRLLSPPLPRGHGGQGSDEGSPPHQVAGASVHLLPGAQQGDWGPSKSSGTSLGPAGAAGWSMDLPALTPPSAALSPDKRAKPKHTYSQAIVAPRASLFTSQVSPRCPFSASVSDFVDKAVTQTRWPPRAGLRPGCSWRRRLLLMGATSSGYLVRFPDYLTRSELMSQNKALYIHSLSLNISTSVQK